MNRDLRLPALRRFAVAITVLNILGHTVLGFEQAWAHLVAAVLTAYTAELSFESLSAWSQRRRPRFLGGGVSRLVDFLLSPHITGCAVTMLLYPGGRVMPIVFAALVAIASKTLFRAPVDGGARHFLNPSNFGITATLVVFPWVAISPPYHFTENLYGWVDWLLPAIIIASGSFLNTRFTRRMPLIAGWLLGFAAQAIVRTTLTGTATLSALLPMTGVAFILFTFYMVTDPATTPDSPRAQAIFGASVAVVYGLLVASHIVFGLFFALTIVTALRGVLLLVASLARRSAPDAARVPA
jgi:hypothetical protein